MLNPSITQHKHMKNIIMIVIIIGLAFAISFTRKEIDTDNEALREETIIAQMSEAVKKHEARCLKVFDEDFSEQYKEYPSKQMIYGGYFGTELHFQTTSF